MTRVVVVEDEHHLRQELVLTTPWEQLGCTVVGEAENGTEALEIILRTLPDLLLADIRMPGMDGITMLETIHARLNPGDAPAVIFLSGYDEFDYARAALRLGAEDYLLKPVDDEELHRVIRAVTRRREQHARERQKELNEEAGKYAENLLPETRLLSRASDYVTEAAEFLQRHLARDVGLAEVAGALGISRSYLSRRFSEETGYTVNEYLTRLRIRAAIELLRDRQLRIKEVMAKCGYHDASYFGQVFRRLVGVTPSVFRRCYAGKALDEASDTR